MDNANRSTRERRRPSSIFARRLPDGGLVEMVYDGRKHETKFVIWRNGRVSYEKRVVIGNTTFVPYSPDNNLIGQGVILLPERAEEYGGTEELIANVRHFIHRYVDLSPVFERLATYYILLTWVYDAFNELPYLRVRGDYGSGKTRVLLILGSICLRPVFAGAATASPLFRILDASRGTLVIDEGDFRDSDEKAAIVKMLNCGHAKGFPVLRSEVVNQREYAPRAFQVFGPKLIATRGFFSDRALESRCLTETLGCRPLRADIPINLPEQQQAEAQTLRNQLLMFRFHNLERSGSVDWVEPGLEPRLNQVFGALMSIIDNDVAKGEVRNLAFKYQRQIVAERGRAAEGQVLDVIQQLEGTADRLQIGIVTQRFIEQYEMHYERRITPRWVGNIIRSQLGLETERRHGNYSISHEAMAQLPLLYRKYGLRGNAPLEGTDPSPEVPHPSGDGGTTGHSGEDIAE